MNFEKGLDVEKKASTPCFNAENDELVEQILSFDVWTIYEDSLYLLGERKKDGKAEASIFVLKRVK